MKYLLDTNIISESIKTTPNKHVLKKIEQHQNEIAIASPVWHELQFGYLRLPPSKKRIIIESFLNDVLASSIIILPYDERAATWHAAERARLSAQGRTPSFVDGQIASIAKVNSLVFVTRNIDDFILFSKLKIENWYK